MKARKVPLQGTREWWESQTAFLLIRGKCERSGWKNRAVTTSPLGRNLTQRRALSLSHPVKAERGEKVAEERLAHEVCRKKPSLSHRNKESGFLSWNLLLVKMLWKCSSVKGLRISHTLSNTVAESERMGSPNFGRSSAVGKMLSDKHRMLQRSRLWRQESVNATDFTVVLF